jgi:hypothetical protein
VDQQAPLSVHHCDWPKVSPALVDEALLAEMKAARTVVTLGHAVRALGNLKVRQPLGRVVVVAPPEQREHLTHNAALVTDELNVKALEFVENEAELVTYKLLPDNRVLGPKFGPLFPKVRAALAAADPQAAVMTLRSGQPLKLEVEGQTVELSPAEVLVTPQPRPGFAVKAEGEYVVALDTTVTPELRAEGLAREVVRRIQDLRKSASFDISDRIVTHYMASEGLASAMAAHAEYIKGETLSLKLISRPVGSTLPLGVIRESSSTSYSASEASSEDTATADDSFDGETLALAVTRVKVMEDERPETKVRRPRTKVTPQLKAKATAKKAEPKATKPKATAKLMRKTVRKAKPASQPRTELKKKAVRVVRKAERTKVKPKTKPTARKNRAARKKTTSRK